MRYLLSLLFMATIISPAFAEILCVNQLTGRILSSPWQGGLVQLEVPVHYPISVVGEKDDFYEVIDYRGRSGWMARGEAASSQCAVVIPERINVRAGPGTTHPVLMKAKTGVAFRVAGTSDEWLLVQHESGKEGWIHRSLLWGMD